MSHPSFILGGRTTSPATGLFLLLGGVCSFPRKPTTGKAHRQPCLCTDRHFEISRTPTTNRPNIRQEPLAAAQKSSVIPPSVSTSNLRSHSEGYFEPTRPRGTSVLSSKAKVQTREGINSHATENLPSIFLQQLQEQQPNQPSSSWWAQKFHAGPAPGSFLCH